MVSARAACRDGFLSITCSAAIYSVSFENPVEQEQNVPKCNQKHANTQNVNFKIETFTFLGAQSSIWTSRQTVLKQKPVADSNSLRLETWNRLGIFQNCRGSEKSRILNILVAQYQTLIYLEPACAR